MHRENYHLEPIKSSKALSSTDSSPSPNELSLSRLLFDRLAILRDFLVFRALVISVTFVVLVSLLLFIVTIFFIILVIIVRVLVIVIVRVVIVIGVLIVVRFLVIIRVFFVLGIFILRLLLLGDLISWILFKLSQAKVATILVATCDRDVDCVVLVPPVATFPVDNACCLNWVHHPCSCQSIVHIVNTTS